MAETARRWYDVKPCGTPAAYRRHIRRGEKIDQTCIEAERRHNRDRWRAKNPDAPRRRHD